MKPGQVGFVPRTRTPWEAQDLGLSLLQVHIRPMATLWLLQVALVLALALPFLWRSPAWCLLALWWLKPWFDRGALFVLGRSVFDQPVSLGDFIGEWKAVHRHGMVAGLLWRRLSPARSFLLPVFQLEGLGGAAYRARTQVLARQGGYTGFILTCTGWIFTALTLVGVLALIQFLTPQATHGNLFRSLGTMTPGTQWILLASGILAMTVIEPFYVAAGFALYLNRRTQLEGWDLELTFRRLAQRLAVTVLLAFGAMSLMAQSPAGKPVQASPDPQAQQRACWILDHDPAFHHTTERHTLQFRPTGKEPSWLQSLLDWLSKRKATPQGRDYHMGESLAFWGKVLIVALLAALALWVLYRYRHLLGARPTTADGWDAPEAVAGLDIRPESLPEDIPTTARKLFAKGQGRAALALLYRGALAELVHGRGMEILASATEGDCLQAAREHLEELPHQTFRTLTAAWQRLAYASQPPEPEAFEALCGAWNQAFGRRP